MTGPEWVQVAGYVGGAFVAFAGPVWGFVVKARRERARAMARVESDKPADVPTDAPLRQPLDVLRERVAFLELQLRVAESVADDLRIQLSETGRDHARTAAELTRVREENERYESELRLQQRTTARPLR